MNRQFSTIDSDALRPVLKSQYHAALAMLLEPIQRCPDELWFSNEQINAPWQIAYHTLFFAHLYLQPNMAAFRPWTHHQSEVQHPDGLTGPADPDSTLPLIPDPYSRNHVLDYWKLCDDIVDSALDRLDLLSPDCGFSWYQVSKLEHQMINIRHIQHGAAQLAARLRSALDIGMVWVGSRPVRDGTVRTDSAKNVSEA